MYFQSRGYRKDKYGNSTGYYRFFFLLLHASFEATSCELTWKILTLLPAWDQSSILTEYSLKIIQNLFNHNSFSLPLVKKDMKKYSPLIAHFPNLSINF